MARQVKFTNHTTDVRLRQRLSQFASTSAVPVSVELRTTQTKQGEVFYVAVRGQWVNKKGKTIYEQEWFRPYRQKEWPLDAQSKCQKYLIAATNFLDSIAAESHNLTETDRRVLAMLIERRDTTNLCAEINGILNMDYPMFEPIEYTATDVTNVVQKLRHGLPPRKVKESLSAVSI